ncbi:UDP-N-acetylglucosamine transferase subunit ALG14-like isoform X2 [Convolutriloba macropyga]|uniref:UDP-N-acetylglucosamine transferase subunit ALG14-like isoform X1 n=1 Tax=Convolutriloba macropyga TaxID=536237 RepID=UPI003F523CD7
MALDLLQTFLASLVIALYLMRFFYLKLKAKTPFSLRDESSVYESGAIRPKRTLIVLGSGGHTTEMLRLIDVLPIETYSPRYYFVANTDKMSIKKINHRSVDPKYIKLIPRSREVGQSYLSSVFSTIIACIYTVPLALWVNPDLLLVNGPGTCLPACLAAVIANLITLNRVTVVFVESICRTESLSLLGKILYKFNIADLFFVQWEKLKQMYPNSIFLGRIV